MAKNITLTVDEGLLARFRQLAAQQRTSVNALVRKHMEDATRAMATKAEALARLDELSRQSDDYDNAHPVADEAQASRFDRENTYAGPRFAQERE